ncbi:MAG: hypothetical protein H0V17_04700 [Deltaproteobacteria bacterium]|nr:hypothetical protein [Deltaproteobacteria bacterium]
MTHVQIIVALFAAACGGKTTGSRVVDGDEANLTDCKILERVKGTASDSASDPATIAKADARSKAAKLGATHIRWIVPCCTTVEGDAFRCDLPD